MGKRKEQPELGFVCRNCGTEVEFAFAVCPKCGDDEPKRPVN